MLKYFALMAAFAAVPAQATNWVYIGTTDSRTTAYFVDRDSIGNGEEGSVAAAAYSVHAKDDPKDGTASAVLSLEFDCATPRYRFRHLVGYDARMKQSYDEVGSGKWRDVTTGSLEAAAHTFVCARVYQKLLNKSYGSSLRAVFAEGRRRLGA